MILCLASVVFTFFLVFYFEVVVFVKMDPEKKEKPDKEKPNHVVVRNTADYQRMKLEKLMKNPDKPVIIPERPKEKGSPHVPDFVRNVMGSSAGAGSGEFHVYRHLRRKEYARQKYMQEKAEVEKQNQEYKKKLDDNKKIAEDRTAKKRAKRLKKKKKQKVKRKKPKLNKKNSSEESEESSSEEESNVNDKESEENAKDKCDNIEGISKRDIIAKEIEDKKSDESVKNNTQIDNDKNEDTIQDQDTSSTGID